MGGLASLRVCSDHPYCSSARVLLDAQADKGLSRLGGLHRNVEVFIAVAVASCPSSVERA